MAAALGIDKKNVTCHVTLLGGGFGRKSKPDYAAEAAVLSKQLGKPVKVVWTREDDIKFDFYHATAAVYHKAVRGRRRQADGVAAAVGVPADRVDVRRHARVPAAASSSISGLTTCRTTSPTSAPRTARPTPTCASAGSAPSPTTSTCSRSAASPTRWRTPPDAIRWSSCSTCSGPGKVLDLKAQGVEYSNYGAPIDKYPIDTRRLRRVLEVAGEKSGWAKRKSGNGKGFGIAAHRSFNTYVASVVQVEVDGRGGFSVPRIDQVVDSGVVINPDRVRSQMEGAAVMGVGLARTGEITAANGRIEQSNFDVSRWRG